MAWKEPDEVDLSTRRPEYTNMYGYAREWVAEYDMFGDEAAIKRAKRATGVYTPALVLRYI